MPERPLHLVDVFAEEKYAGNQLAVVRDAGDLTADEMQAVAREMNYSETTFVEASEPRDGGWDVRIFTPKHEIPFAGHPTLGTAHVIREHLAAGRPDEVVLNLGVGPIPVTVEREAGAEVLWMAQQEPKFGESLDPDAAAAVLGLDPSHVDDDVPVRVVSTGLPTLLVPLVSLDAVERAGALGDPYYEHVVDGMGVESVLCFTPETLREDNDLHARMFAPAHGVEEDPATGSANGCLAAYLARERYFDDPEIDVRVEQGYEMGRPSLLLLRASDGGDSVPVHVGGSVVPVADGRLL